jgi:urea transport system ATP-binding protein
MLAVRALDHLYGSSHTLRSVDLDVPAGAVTALLGRNGVGKSTLLRCIMGVERVRAGRIELDGRDITNLRPEERAALGLGYVPQGRENLQMGLASRRGAVGRRIPEEVYEMFPVLRQMRGRRGGDLSGGQQQQLAIGRALVMRPRVLILDEPTEGIQPSIIKDIERAIRALAQRGEMAILLVEQYYDFAQSLADHFAVLNRGVVVKSGSGDSMANENVRGLLAV